MGRTKNVEELIGKFPKWDKFFIFTLPWNASKQEQNSYFYSFYAFLTLRTNITNFSVEEANDFFDYLQSTRIPEYRFLTNLENPDKPKNPSDSWIDEKTRDISRTFQSQDLKILKGAVNVQKCNGQGTLVIPRPYDFSIFERKK